MGMSQNRKLIKFPKMVKMMGISKNGKFSEFSEN
jgi:hypothetical protein